MWFKLYIWIRVLSLSVTAVFEAFHVIVVLVLHSNCSRRDISPKNTYITSHKLQCTGEIYTTNEIRALIFRSTHMYHSFQCSNQPIKKQTSSSTGCKHFSIFFSEIIVVAFLRVPFIIPPVYEVYRGYIVFAFSVCSCVCNHFFHQRFLSNYLT